MSFLRDLCPCRPDRAVHPPGCDAAPVGPLAPPGIPGVQRLPGGLPVPGGARQVCVGCHERPLCHGRLGNAPYQCPFQDGPAVQALKKAAREVRRNSIAVETI